MGGATEHLGPAAQRRTQIGLAGFALPHFQQACSELCACHGVVRTVRQRMPVTVGGRGIFAIQQPDAGQCYQNLRMPRSRFASFQEDGTRLGALVPLKVQPRKVDLQIDGFRRQSKTVFNDGDGLIEASGFRKLAGEFLEGRDEWRPPRCGAPQLFDCFFAASGAAQRRSKQYFDTRIAAAARRLFDRRDRLLATVLIDEGASQNRHGGDVGPAHSQ